MKKWEEKKLTQHQQASIKEEKLRSKYLYKITLLLLKYIPVLMACIDFTHTICSYYEIKIQPFLELFGGISILSIMFIYLASYTFQFCETHRIPLHYIVISNLIATYDQSIGIPINDKQMFCVYLIVLGLAIILYSYYHVKNNQKHSKKDSR